VHRLVAIAGVLLFLSGCETDEDFWRPYDYVVSKADAEFGLARRDRKTYGDEQCAKIAQQRADDAATYGEDDDTVRAIYADAYANCADWKRRHGL